MSILGVNGTLAGAYQYANRTQKTAANGASFMEQLQKTGESGALKADAYTEYLKQKYGAGVSIQNVGKDQRSMDNIGAGTAGTGNVVIASNILEQMANDPEKAAYYEKKIQEHFDSLPQTEAFMAAVGHKITSCGVVVHEDGTVTYYLSGEESPEKKAARRQENLKRSQEAAEKRRQEMEIAYRKQTMEEMLASRVIQTGGVTYAGTPGSLRSAVAAYEMSAFITPGILK